MSNIPNDLFPTSFGGLWDDGKEVSHVFGFPEGKTITRTKQVLDMIHRNNKQKIIPFYPSGNDITLHAATLCSPSPAMGAIVQAGIASFQYRNFIDHYSPTPFYNTGFNKVELEFARGFVAHYGRQTGKTSIARELFMDKLVYLSIVNLKITYVTVPVNFINKRNPFYYINMYSKKYTSFKEIKYEHENMYDMLNSEPEYKYDLLFKYPM